MSIDAVWAELKTLYQNHSEDEPVLTEAHIQKWVRATGASKDFIYDQIAILLARAFHAKEVDFAFCDAVMNDLHGVITGEDKEPPKLFWKIFLAFDAGEFMDTGKRGNPVDVYTRPQIAEILKTLK